MSTPRIHAMFCVVLRHRWQHLKVLWAVVRFITVDVMHHLALPQKPTYCVAGYKSVLVHVPPTVSKRVIWTLDEVVPTRCERPASPPIGIAWPRMNDAHAHRVAHRNPACQVKCVELPNAK